MDFEIDFNYNENFGPWLQQPRPGDSGPVDFEIDFNYNENFGPWLQQPRP